MNWKMLLWGAGLAALAGVLQFGQTLPPPWSAIATALLVLVAHFTPSSLPAAK